MGEAKQRRHQLQQLNLSAPGRRADIARCVRSIGFDIRGGTCAFRTMTGQIVLTSMGVRSRIVFGAMLYRTGPDPIADTVAFCGPTNRALRLADKVLGHYWLEAGPDLIDFTVGDWRVQGDTPAGDPLYDTMDGVPIPPARWTRTVPDFWWRPSIELTRPWRATTTKNPKTPALGVAWYHAEEDGDVMLQDAFAGKTMRAAASVAQERVEQLLSDWRTGNRSVFKHKIIVS
jgi:hypothetical protein